MEEGVSSSPSYSELIALFSKSSLLETLLSSLRDLDLISNEEA
jgi:hypothetical protein